MSSGYPDLEICSRCKDNTGFEQDEDTGEWLSVCCGARAIDVCGYDDDDFDYLESLDSVDDYDTHLHSDELLNPEDLE